MAPEPWAGCSVPLNAIAPGMVIIAMTKPFLETGEGRPMIREGVPMLLNGLLEARVTAELLAWLVSKQNSHLRGQVVFVDRGSDAVIRGDSTW